MSASSVTNHPADTARGRLRRRAFTLAEMSVSAAVTALLMLSIGAALVIASRSLPDPKAPVNVSMAAASALGELGDDLSCALRVTEQTSKSITFTVADRNDADASVERIRYAWSGVAGDPLTRSYNGGTPVTVIASVQSLAFTYQTRTVSESYEAKAVETAELLLKSNDSSSNTSTAHVHKDSYTGQYVLPSLPANTKSWSMTRVLYRAKEDNSSGDSTLYVQLRPAASDKRPTLTVLDQSARSESTLTDDMAWYQSAFTGAGAAGLDPSKGICVVMMTGASNQEAAEIEYNSSGVAAANAGFEEYTGSIPEVASSWRSVPTNKALRYFAYGKAIAVPSGAASLSATRTYVTGVRVSLNPGAASDNPMEVTFQTANEPEVVEVAWDTDLSSNPTAIDNDGDGLGDWTLRTGNVLSASTFSGGVWSLSGTGSLDAVSAAAPAFAGLTTASVRFRDTTSGDGGVSLRLNVGRANGSVAPVVATLTLQSDGTQTLTLQLDNGSGTLVTPFTCRNLSASLATVRLMADAASGTVNLRVDDGELGTFGYALRAAGIDAAETAGASISLAGGSAEVDSISVHAGRAP